MEYAEILRVLTWINSGPGHGRGGRGIGKRLGWRQRFFSTKNKSRFILILL